MERIRAWGPRAIALAGFAAYALLAPPGPHWLDSSELAAAAIGLGSPHPTGFPLVCMLAKLASLVPVGELVFRVHLLGALCAALAILWTARLVEAAAGGTQGAAGAVGGLAAGLLLGVTLTFARAATVVDGVAPTAALLAATALLFDRVARGGDARAGLLLAWTAGIGLGAHPLYRLIVPVPLALLLWVRLRGGARWPLVAPLVAVSVGAAIQLVLPVRSAGGVAAALDWGHPRDLAGAASHVAGPAVRGLASMTSAQPEVVRESAARFLGGMIDQIGVLGIVAALAGAASLLLERRSRWLLVLLAVAAAGEVVHAVWIEPVVGQGGALFALAAAALAGLGVAWLGRFVGPAAGGAAAAVAGAMLLAGPALVTGPELRAGATGDAARRYAEEALDSTPPRAVILSRSEPLSGLLLYLWTAEGARPDAAPLDRPRLARDLERSRAIAGAVEADRPILGLGERRAIAWEPGEDPAPWPIEMRSVLGVALPVAAAGEPSRDIALAAGRLAALFDDAAGDPIARRVGAQAVTELGRMAAARADLPLALRLLDAAIALQPDHAEAWIERGAVFSGLGRMDDAARSAERAIALEPHRVAALLGAARYRLALGQLAPALDHAERAIRLAADLPDGWVLAALADARAGRAARARERLTRALTLDPNQAEARSALRALHQTP